MLTFEQEYQLNEYSHLAAIKPEQAEEFKNDFTKHIPEIQKALQALQDRGDFPYNSDVIKEARKYPEFANMPESTLSHYVYTGGHYRRGKDLAAYVDGLKYTLTSEGYQPITETSFNALVGTRKEIMVYTERHSDKYIKARLIKDAEGAFFWVMPRFTRRGYRAKPGDYVKAIETTKKKTIEAQNDQRSVATAAISLF